MANILVTGAAGFIGSHLAAALARAGHHVAGCDSFNGYYDVALKQARVQALLAPAGVVVERCDVSDAAAVEALFTRRPVDIVLHLAAQAGVRHSVQAPMDYVRANLLGFGVVLDAARRHGVRQLFYASSSSVYGRRADTGAGSREDEPRRHPASFYAATKQANEAMAHATAAVHGLPVTGLRFFTVYGPWGRPDMACWGFTERMLRGQSLRLYGRGELLRDFTYVDDVCDAVLRLVTRGPGRPDAEGTPAEIFNVGHRQPVRVLDFVRTLETVLGAHARIELAPLEPGDVPNTCADPSRLLAAIGPWEATPLVSGLERFAQWYRQWARLQPQGAPALKAA